jgi:glutamate/tyrosine decarboxylase-like PLP-dependent enzyme
MISEFGRSDEKTSFVMPPPRPFPETGSDEAGTLEAVRHHLAQSPYPVDQNFGISYVGPAHRIARLAGDLARETVFVEWATDIFPGTFALEKEAVRMVATLLGAPEAVGFITSGGTESNMLAMRLARNVSQVRDPEIVLPETAHFSFRLAGELFGLRLRELSVNADGAPDTKALRAAVNRRTVALVCSAPEGKFWPDGPSGGLRGARRTRRDLSPCRRGVRRLHSPIYA